MTVANTEKLSALLRVLPKAHDVLWQFERFAPGKPEFATLLRELQQAQDELAPSNLKLSPAVREIRS